MTLDTSAALAAIARAQTALDDATTAVLALQPPEPVTPPEAPSPVAVAVESVLPPEVPAPVDPTQPETPAYNPGAAEAPQ